MGAFSEFRFGSVDSNPLWVCWYASGNAYQLRARQDFRFDAEPDDERVAFWVEPDTLPGAVRPQLDHVRYHARNNELPQARALINEVRTQCASPHANEPTGAGLC